MTLRAAGLAGSFIAAAALLAPLPAYACSPIYVPEAERENHAREVQARLLSDGREADSIVTVRVMQTRGFESILTVTEILRDGRTRKSLKVGQQIPVTTSPHSACGTGSLPQGMEAALIYRRNPVFSFQGFLTPAELTSLRNAGIIAEKP